VDAQEIHTHPERLRGREMSNIQDSSDDREIPLDRVGVTDLVYPVTVPDREGGTRDAEAAVGLFVELDQETRGVHMSRLVEAFEAWRGTVLTPENLQSLLARLRDAVAARTASVELEYTHFVERAAPVSGAVSLLAIPVAMDATLTDSFEMTLTVETPVLSVCPCSLEATGGPTHSQRGYVAVSVRVDGRMWVDELVELVEDSASGPVLALMKAADERSVIEAAFRKPVFVEDLARNVAERLESDVRVRWYRVEAENLESVHGHNAYASVERSR
jgi:GTP cyclohydrolase I